MMVRAIKTLLAGGIAVGLAACASVPAAEEETEVVFTPPPVGTEIDWQFVYEGGSDLVTSRVVATGPDFTVFQADTSYPAGDPFDFFVEFSGGLFYATCDGRLPPVTERMTALSHWPLDEGGTFSVSGDLGGDVEIGKPASVMVSKEAMNVVWSSFSYVEDGVTYTDRAAISTELGTVVEMRWNDGAVDLIRDVRLGDGSVDMDADELQQALGNCGKLIGGK